MEVLLNILPWLLGGGVGTFLLGRFFDTVTPGHQAKLYASATRLDKWIKKLSPLQFIFSWIKGFARHEQMLYGGGRFFWLQAAPMSFLFLGIGGMLCSLYLPPISYPHPLKTWIIVGVMFGVLGAIPCWHACLTSRLVLNRFSRRESWWSIFWLVTLPLVSMALISFLALTAAAVMYIGLLKVGSAVGFSVDDLRAVSYLWIMMSLFGPEPWRVLLPHIKCVLARKKSRSCLTVPSPTTIHFFRTSNSSYHELVEFVLGEHCQVEQSTHQYVDEGYG